MLCKADAPMAKGWTSACGLPTMARLRRRSRAGGGWTGIIEGVSPQYMRCRNVSRSTAVVSAAVLSDGNGRMR